MEDRPGETADREEMEKHSPIYPLPLEIQQMEHSETVCQYCGVSYLILHEFQRMQERLRAMERELDQYKGSEERARGLQDQLKEANARLEELAASHRRQADSVSGLDLQLAKNGSLLESVSAEKDVMQRELGKTRGSCLVLRRRNQLLQQALNATTSLLRLSRQELLDVQRDLSQVYAFWEGWSVHLLQRCQDADAERLRQERAVDRSGAEVSRLREQVDKLVGDLASSELQAGELQNQLQAQTALRIQLQEGKNELKKLHQDLQGSRAERENLVKLLETKSRETDELNSRQLQLEDHRDNLLRLSEELKETEESRLACQRRCQSLEEQLCLRGHQEEELKRRHRRAEGENRTLRGTLQQVLDEISGLKQEREQATSDHQATVSRLEESFRLRLVEGEERWRQERAQLELQFQERELRLKRDGTLELDIEREKNQELLRRSQRDKDLLKKKLPSLVHAATRELREDVVALQEKLQEAQARLVKQEARREEEALHLRKTATELEQQLSQERATADADLQLVRRDGQQGALKLEKARLELEKLRQETTSLQEENVLLQETVRRECEEREELTAALTLAREQLLQLRHSSQSSSPTHEVITASPPGPGDPKGSGFPCRMSAKRTGEGRNVASWHGSSRGESQPPVALPKLPRERPTSASEARHRFAQVTGRKERARPPAGTRTCNNWHLYNTDQHREPGK